MNYSGIVRARCHRCIADKPDRTAIGALAGLKAFQLSTREERGLASGCLANGCHLESRAYQERFRPIAAVRQSPLMLRRGPSFLTSAAPAKLLFAPFAWQYPALRIRS
jgi:hypothetical protein